MSGWLDLVFHVLAHVEATARLAPSCFDPSYVAFARGHLGDPDARPLGEDRRTLGRALASHGALARAQLLAWLFDDLERARALAERDLRALSPAELARPELLAPLLEDEPGAELLRAAALLEDDAWSRLPPLDEAAARARLAPALASVAAAAPALEACEVRCARALRLRGRVLRDHGRACIWVGAPGDAPPLEAAHAAWQAAHEATVFEVGEVARAEGLAAAHAPLEHAALILLAARAAEARLGDAHAAWLGHLGAVPSLALDALPARWRALVERLLRG